MRRLTPLRAALLGALTALTLVAAASAIGWLRAWPFPWRLTAAEPVGTTVYRLRPGETPYTRWIDEARKRQPVFSGLLIDDVRTHPLQYWPAMGVQGLYVQMADYQIVDGWILEIPPGGSMTGQRHLFEVGFYFFGGPGHTIVQQEGQLPQRVNWKYKSLLSIPLNVRYQHFNDGPTPVRIVAVTSFPYVINSTDSVPFVFDNPFAFRDRFEGSTPLGTTPTRVGRNRMRIDAIDDALAFRLDDHDMRGPGATNMHWSMSGNTMIDLHASEIPARIYKRAHRHSSDAFILLLSGNGYSLTWPEGRQDKRIRVDWHEGTMFVPPIYWYHQHLNPGATPARYLAINASMLVERLGLRFYDQIEPDVPEIMNEFQEELRRGRTDAR